MAEGGAAYDKSMLPSKPLPVLEGKVGCMPIFMLISTGASRVWNAPFCWAVALELTAA